MKNKSFLFLATIMLCLCGLSGQAQAKDLMFYLGYGNIDVLTSDTDEVIKSIPVKGWLRDYTFTPNHNQMLVTANRHIVHILDTKKLSVVKSYDLNNNKEGWEYFIFGIVADSDNKTYYAHLLSRRTEGGEAIIGKPVVAQIDIESGKILRKVEVPRGVFVLLNVKDGKEIYAIGLDIYKIDASGKDMKVTETHSMFDKGMNALALWHFTFESGGYFVSPYYNAEGCGMLEIDTHTGAITESMINGVPFVYNFAYSPDRSKVYGGMDEVYKIDMKTKNIEAFTEIAAGTNFAVQTSSDGKKVYMSAGGSDISVFDSETLALLKVIEVSTDGMTMARLKL